MTIAQLMERSPVTVGPGDSVRDAARLLRRANVGALPVVNAAGALKGILTDRDIVLRCLAAGGDPDRMSVGSCMTKEPVTVSPGEPAETAARLMAANGVRRIPAVEDGTLIGMVSLGDLSKARALRMEAAKALTEISLGVRKLSDP